METTPIGSYRLRVYFNFGSSKKAYKTYELFHVTRDDSFEVLKRKVTAKMGISRGQEHHYYFSLQRLHTIEKGGKCLRPYAHDRVCEVIEREELRWAGECCMNECMCMCMCMCTVHIIYASTRVECMVCTLRVVCVCWCPCHIMSIHYTLVSTEYCSSFWLMNYVCVLLMCDRFTDCDCK